MPNWENIFKDYILPAAGVGIPAILGNRAQAGGIDASKLNLDEAYNRGQGAIANAVNAAQPQAAWAYNQNVGNLGTGYNNALTNAQWGFDTSNQMKQQALGNALSSGQQGFNAAQSALAPYAQMGNNAMAQLSQHVLGSKGAIPQQQWQQPQLNPGMLQFTGRSLPPQQPFSNAMLPKFNNPVAGGIGGNSLSNATSTSLQDNTVGKSLGGGLASALGPIAGGLAGGAALGGTALGAFAGPIGAGIGAAIGPLIGHFTRRGREKEAATKGIDELRTIVWDQIIPAYKSGQIDATTAKQLVDQNWQEYVNWLRGNLEDETVISRTIASQGKWLYDPINQLFGASATPSA